MPSADDLLDRHDATTAADAIRSGDVSPRELVEAAISRIEARNPDLNAVVSTRFDQALAEADAIDRARPFAGVPFVVKDLGTDVAGLPHTRGSRLFADDVSTADSELVRRYKAAGFVILAKTNTPELGKNASTEPLLHGPTRNPHGLGHSTGGSSGGTAAAIASGMVAIGHGNDGGGSIRIPSSACGLFGLKPSRSRITADPSRSLLSYPMGINHVLTRSVRDSAAVLDLTAGPMPGDPYQIAPPARPWLDEVGADPGRLRIALDPERAGYPSHPDCVAATTALASTLESLGHEIVEAGPDYPDEAIGTVMRTIMGVPTAVEIDRRLAALGRELGDDDLEPFSRMMYDVARPVTGAQVIEALELVEDIARSIGAFFVDHDLLLTPVLAQPVPPLGYLDTTDIESMVTRAGTYSALTSPYNTTGQPAVSLPVGRDAAGRPIGVQLVATFGREDQLVAVSSQVEQAVPWSTEAVWPPVPAD